MTVTRAEIEAEARRIGFDAFGIAPPTVPDRDRERLEEVVAQEQYGQMAWMAETLERRRDPQTLWPDVRSVIVLGASYAPAHNPLGMLSHKERAAISAYAKNKDYHDVVKKRLKQLARWLVEKAGCEVKVFVDTAPVMEKTLAKQAGIGWQGKHTNILSREEGNWLFLGEVFTTLDLEPDAPERDHCGSCTACQDICPTNAFPEPYKLDPSRCISYLTIEHKGPIPEEFRDAIGNRIYGCDDCVAVCPWNKFAQASTEMAFMPRIELTAPRLSDFLEFDEQTFRDFFSGSPIKRIKWESFMRNVIIACGNSGMAELAQKIRPFEAGDNAVLRDAAAWALRKLDREHSSG